jgi:F-type H+-transporting ATPase subunit alpha
VDRVRSWERQYMEYMETSAADILTDIRDKKALDDDLTSRLRKAAEDFNKTVSVEQLETTV